MESFTTIFAGGEERVLSCQPRTMPVGDPRCSTGVVGLGNAPALIARKDWPRCIDLSTAIREILNQKTTSLCHSFAGTQLNEMVHRLAGRKDVLLSAGHLAGQVTGYRNEGAAVDQVLAVLLKSGQCRRDTVGQFDYDGGWPEKAQEEGLAYLALDAWDCGHERVFDGCVSNVIVGNPVELGTHAFGGGHAVVQAGYFIDKSGVVRPFGPNSWGEDWTNWTQAFLEEFAQLCPDPDHSHLLQVKGKGYWVFREEELDRGLPLFGAFGVQSTVANQDDVVPSAA